MTAIDSLASDHDVTWIASAISDEDRGVAQEAERHLRRDALAAARRFALRLVAHDPAAYDRYYNVVANPMLWFIQHRLWDLGCEPGARRVVSRGLARAATRR